nr:Rrf2 family transcriptional regulator [uncultured bacterium]
MFSNSSKYAIKALIHLVSFSSEDNKITVKHLAEATAIPQPYLSKILLQLTAKDFLSSTKGPHGGYFILKAQQENSLLDIIVEMEGKDNLRLCVLSFENCNEQNPCPIHNLVAERKDGLRYSLKNIKLKNLSDVTSLIKMDK